MSKSFNDHCSRVGSYVTSETNASHISAWRELGQGSGPSRLGSVADNEKSLKPSSMLDPRTSKALNRRLLASQYLSRKATGPRAVVEVSDACCGINSQDFLESFSSYWARVDGFRDSDLTSELRPRGGLVRTWTVRFTMHTIPAKDYWVYVFGGPTRRFTRSYFDRIAKPRCIPECNSRVRLLYQPLLDHIKGRAVTSNEIKEFMVEKLTQHGLRGRMKLQRGWSSQASSVPSWTGLGEMSNLGLIVNAGRKGSQSLWMRTNDRLALDENLLTQRDARSRWSANTSNDMGR